ncbi:HAD family hydrolase [Edaphobacter albus]|uniref:HAD family hydrolase n=1 Tax=Edaphobacter sp. 4G125 TaxID=2763071 RepID=UPI001647D880|nr:HAD family phosphatase [Edaphobacter sp. 4G125]QNI36154.1 HAD family phosphatase [Edaphobacter sp. 4G125]
MKLKLPEGDFKAYLFDCDGTIADSMPLHYIAWKSVLSEWNCEFAEELFYQWGGMPVVEIISTLNQRHGLSMPVRDIQKRKEELFYANLPLLKAVPEVLEHIEARHGDLPFAVVSGSTRDSVQASLRALHLLDRFQTLVCAGDYARSKPHPEPFLMAAERLGVAPEQCLVFEDTQMGIDAATAAGMASVRVPAPWERASNELATATVGNG